MISSLGKIGEPLHMSKRHLYFKSISYQLLACGIFTLGSAFIFTMLDLSFFGYVAKGIYIQLPYDILWNIYREKMTPELGHMVRVYSSIIRVVISLIVGLLSVRFKRRYAVLAEVLICFVGLFLYVVSSMQ